MNDGSHDKKVKEKKKRVINRVPKFKDCKKYLQNDKIILKSQLFLMMLQRKLEQNITQNGHTFLAIHTEYS